MIRSRTSPLTALRALAAALGAVAVLLGSAALAQRLETSGAGELEAVPLLLGDGRLALLVERQDEVIVDRVLPGVGADRPQSPLDVEAGDRVLGLGGRSGLSLADLQGAYRALAEGDLVELDLDREGRGPLTVVFERPPQVVQVPSVARRMVMIAEDDPSAAEAEDAGHDGGGGQWVMGEPGDAPSSIDLIGWMVRAAEDGRPVVAFGGTHPGRSAVALELGDVVLAVDGVAVSRLSELDAIWRAVGAGDRVVVEVARGDREIEVSFVRPEGE